MMRFKLTSLSAMLLAATMALPSTIFAQDTTPKSTNSAQVPQPDPSGVNWKGVGVGAGTVAANLLYVPAKLVYGILGGIGGGAGYALTGGNQQVANTIWRSSLGGDYVLTPEMITGKQPVHFSGPTQTAQPPTVSGGMNGAPGVANTAAPLVTATAPHVSNAGPTTQPIDSGAGPLGPGPAVTRQPVGGSATPPTNDGEAGSSAKSAPPLPSTSIE
jgi:hypothetical protein